MKDIFSWVLFKDNIEIESYINLEYNTKEKKFVVSENLFLIYQDTEKALYKKTSEYEIKIDFLKKEIGIDFLEYNKNCIIELSLVELNETKEEINISYKIEGEAELTKLNIKKKMVIL